MIFGPELAKEPLERTCGRELRAFAGAKLRPAAPIRAQIHNPIFKIRYVCRSHLDVYFRSGRSLRRSASDAEELRAFAAGGSGPLRFLIGTANS